MRFLAFFFYFISLVRPDLGEIRKNYPLANANEEITVRMYDALSDISREDKAILIAYKGGVATLMAKHANGIKNKKAYFKEGVEFLNHAIEIEPKNAEIRCIRLSVQENAPKITGYHKNIDEDKRFILEHFPAETSKEIKDFIKGYVQQSEAFSPDEKQLF